MTKRICFVMVLMLILSCKTWKGKSGDIRGVVTRKDNQQVLKHVEVSLSQMDFIVTANDSGEYWLINVPVGNYDITFSHPGFESYRVEGFVVKRSGQHKLDVTLQPVNP